MTLTPTESAAPRPRSRIWLWLWIAGWALLAILVLRGVLLHSVFTEAALLGAALAILGRTGSRRTLGLAALVVASVELSAYWLAGSARSPRCD